MTADHEPKPRHLIVGEQTKDVKLGAEIVVADPSARRYVVDEVNKEDGRLYAELTDLTKNKVTHRVPIVLGTPVIVRDPE